MSSVSIVMNDPQNNAQASSPVSVLKRKSDSNVTRKAVKSKRRRSAKGKPHCRYSASEGGQSESPDLLLLDEVADSFSDKQVRTRKMSDLLQLHSVERNENPNLASTQPLNLNMEPAKVCMHCDSSSTPQWRDGPMGPKTLCNACGIQFKCGRLTADYRPLRSPSFNPSVHTNLTKTKKKEMSKNSLNSAPSAKRNQEMKLMDHSKMYQDHSPKAKTTQGMIEEIGDLLESGSRLCTVSPKIKSMKLDNTTVENQYPTHQQKEQEKRNSSDCEMSWNCGPKATQGMIEEIGELLQSGSRLCTDIPKIKSMKLDNTVENQYPTHQQREQEKRKSSDCEMSWSCAPKATQGMIEEIGDLPESGSRLCTDSPKIQILKLDNTTVENQYPTHQQKEQEKRKSSDCEMSWNCAPKSTPDITEETGEPFDQCSGLINGNLTPKQILGKKLPKQVARECLHCESTKTPQWRPGPMGRNTLCNACGVQYKNGRLFPEYRPLKSPTYDPSVHSHLPKKVLEMRMSRNIEKCAISGDSEQPVSSNSFTHLFRVH